MFAKVLSWRTCLVAIAVAFVGIGFLPQLVSSRWIYEPLLQRLKAEDFHLHVGEVTLRWFSPIRLKGIIVEQQSQPEIKLLSIHEVVAEKGLIGFLLSSRQLGRWELIEPVIDIELLQEGSNVTNLVRAIGGKSREEQPKHAPPAIDVEVSVQRASVVVHKGDAGQPLVVIPPFNVDLSFRSANGEPLVHVKPARLLDRVKLTPELMKLGLELAIPTLSKSTWLDGEISLDSGDVKVPLNRPLESAGECVLTLHSVRAGIQEPAFIGVAKMLAHLAGQESDGEVFLVDSSHIQIKLEHGFLTHEGTRIGLPHLDERLQVATSGRVGIVDRSLDSTIEFPIPLEWLARSAEVREMGVPTVRLPVTGTIDKPVVDWMAMRGESAQMLALIQTKLGDDSPAKSTVVSALQGLAGGNEDEAIRATAELFGKLREVRKQKQKQAENDPAEQKPATENPLAEPQHGLLIDLLRKRLGRQ